MDKAVSDQLVQIKDLLTYLKLFVRDPIGTIKNPAPVNWPTMLALQALVAVCSGALVGFFHFSFTGILIGIFVFPLTALIMSFLFALFVYYYFSIFHSTFLDLKRLHSIVILSTLPYFVLHLISGFLPPIDLIGFAMASVLLVVGVTEQFSLPKRNVMRLVGGLYLVFALMWGVAQIRMANERQRIEDLTRPQSLDRLERELFEKNQNR